MVYTLVIFQCDHSILYNDIIQIYFLLTVKQKHSSLDILILDSQPLLFYLCTFLSLSSAHKSLYGGHTFLCVRIQQIHSEILHDLSNWTDQFFYNLQNLPSASFSVHNGRFSLFSIFYSSLVRRTFVSMKRL